MSKNQKLKVINKVNNNTLMEHLNIEFIDVGNDYLTAKMPVSSKVHQPDGVLHGGATVAHKSIESNYKRIRNFS